MKLRKKLAVYALAAVLAVSLLTACGPEETPHPGGGSGGGSSSSAASGGGTGTGGNTGTETPGTGTGGGAENPGGGESGGTEETPGTGGNGSSGSTETPGTGGDGSTETPGGDKGDSTTDPPAEKTIPWVSSKLYEYADACKKGTYELACLGTMLKASEPYSGVGNTLAFYRAEKDGKWSDRLGYPGRLDGETWSIFRENSTYRINREAKQIVILPGEVMNGDVQLWTMPFAFLTGEVTQGTEERADGSYLTESFASGTSPISLSATYYFQAQTGALRYGKVRYTDAQGRWYVMWVEYQTFTTKVADDAFDVPTEGYTIYDQRTAYENGL